MTQVTTTRAHLDAQQIPQQFCGPGERHQLILSHRDVQRLDTSPLLHRRAHLVGKSRSLHALACGARRANRLMLGHHHPWRWHIASVSVFDRNHRAVRSILLTVWAVGELMDLDLIGRLSEVETVALVSFVPSRLLPTALTHTRPEEMSQELEGQDEWTTEVVPRFPAHLEAQAKKLKGFERCREIRSATDVLRGLLAWVSTAHSFQQVSLWSGVLGLADVSANAWRTHVRNASAWLDWLLQDVLAMAEPLAPWLMRGGLKRIVVIDGTHGKGVGPQGIVRRVHTAFDVLAGRLTPVKVTDGHDGEHREVFERHKREVVVTDRANG